MKTIELYLLLILFFNIFITETSLPSSIDTINLDTTLSTIDSTNLDTTETTNSVNIDSIETNTADTAAIIDSIETNLVDTSTITDLKETNLEDTTSTTDSKGTNLVDTTSTTDSKETNLDTTLSTGSKETNLDTTSSTDSKETNLDTTSTTDSSNGNQTDPSYPIPTIKPRLILVGFGGFQRPIRALVTFKVYFKRFLINISSKVLYFTVNIFYTRRLRYLEEVKQNSTCILISQEDNDNMAYNCSVPVEENKDFTISANDDFIFENLSPDLIISSYANSTMKSLSSLINDPYEGGFLTLSNSILTQDDMKFRIEGYLMEDESLNDKQITLSLDQNGDGNLVNVTCNVNDKGSKKYELVCTSDKKIKAHLEGVMGKTSGKPLLILMADNTNDLVDLKIPTRTYNSNHSSNGLSGGAIAGIVIACCVALIAAAIVAYLCVRNPKPPVQEASALEIYTSNASGNNI